MATPIFDHLNAEQANGLACIVDGIDFTTDGRPHVPVGISGSTRSQVFACATPCAGALGYRPDESEQMELAP
jgi:hypothetical protein